MKSPTRDKLNAVLVFPVRNEKDILEQSVGAAYKICDKVFREPWQIIISDNGSTDNTSQLADQLADKFQNVQVIGSPKAGKGGAVRRAWLSVEAEYYFFSDIDLSADLMEGLACLLKELKEDADIAIGSRQHSESVIDRPTYRSIISRGYQILAKLITGTTLHDLPCGLKGVRQKVIKELLPAVKSDGWFFDSELLLLAVAKGYKVNEVPVNWVEYRYGDRPRSIPILKTAIGYIKSLLRIRKRLNLIHRE